MKNNTKNVLMEIITNSVEQTIAIGEQLGKTLCGGQVVILSGELGAGKTHFTKGIGKALGVSAEITSPTFAIHKTYQGKLDLQHFDFYRLGEEEANNLGFEEIIGRRDSVTVIEWAANAPCLIPMHYVNVDIDRIDDKQRKIRVTHI